jgi:aldehyde:ferredoxin oxidoreductase
MANGYTGKILRINLTTRSISSIDTGPYEQWGGGHGIGTALFWDLCKDKTVGFADPGNVVTIMTSPLSGTPVPTGSRLEMQGIGAHSYPVEWFNRTNMGGRFGSSLKQAGWDGLVLEGKASSLCWLNINNDKVTIEDASMLKGMSTWDAQQEIWSLVEQGAPLGQWMSVGSGLTTQKPAILTIGLAGENLVRIAAIVSDAGQGMGVGFGAVLGAKNVKAIAARGTLGVSVADPKALMAHRMWVKNDSKPIVLRQDPWEPAEVQKVDPIFRMSACQSCCYPDHARFRTGVFNGSQCAEESFYSSSPRSVNPKLSWDDGRRAADFSQKYGINSQEAGRAITYLMKLYKRGDLGPGKKIDPAPLDMGSYGTLGWAEEFCRVVTNKEGIGADLADGVYRAAMKWGTLQQDLETGVVNNLVPWSQVHSSLPEVSWAYGQLFGERDVNEHTFSDTYGMLDRKAIPADKFVEIMSQKLVPFTGDPLMFDYSDSDTGIYSSHMAKTNAWARYYSRFWKQGILFCEANCRMPSFVESDYGKTGLTPDYETKFFQAVTGKNLSFADCMKIGQKIWNMDRSIWILQGRTRDMEKFAPFMAKPGVAGGSQLPSHKSGAWAYEAMRDRVLEPARVENFKDEYYKLEGWDLKTGWPTRATLEGLGLKNVAEALAAKNKIGGST